MTNKPIAGRYALGAAVCALFFLISCSQEPIFYSIEREVEQKKATIFGIVYSVVYFNNYYYAANGSVKKKEGGTKGDWENASTPEGFVIRLAATAQNLYALTSSYDVYYRTKDTETWTRIDADNVKTIFDDGQSAYVTTKDGVFELSSSSVGIRMTGNGADEKTISAARIGTTPCFSSTQAFTSSGTRLYKLFINENKDAKIQWSDDNITWETFDKIIAASTPALAFWQENPATSWLIAGTGSSIKMIRLENGIPVSIENPAGNALSVLGDMRIFDGGLYVLPYQNATQNGNVIFASVAYLTTSKRNGLRGYYNVEGDKVWNRE